MNDPIDGALDQAPKGTPPRAPVPQPASTVDAVTSALDTLGGSTEDLPRVPGYAVSHEIARGGMGVVYAAHDPSFDRPVAVKIMHHGQDPERFVVESRLTGQLPHPGVPPVYTNGRLPDGRPFLVMKLVQGRTLAGELRRSDATHLQRLLGVLEQIGQTVGFAHSRGVVHRDLKPSNVMVGDFGEVLVMDWGLAKELERAGQFGGGPAEGLLESAVTLAGTVKGTPAYMAPEQARGEPVDARADVFALGGILAVMLTGRPPFRGETARATVLQAAEADLSGCFELLDGCGADGELIALTKRCLSARRDERPGSGTEVAEAVGGYRADVENRLREAERLRAAAEARAEEERKTREEVAARQSAERAGIAESRKRRRAQWALAGALALLLAAGGAGTAFASLWRTAEASRAAATQLQEAAEAEKAGAEHARDELAGQKKLVESARDEVGREKERLAAFEYGRSIQVAYQEWRDDNISTARKILAGTRPDLRGWEYDFVYRLCHGELLILDHGVAGTHVATATFNPAGTRVLSAHFDGTAVVSDAKTGKRIVTLSANKGTGDDFVRMNVTYSGIPPTGMTFASFSPDGGHVVTASDDHFARVWDAEGGKEVIKLRGHTGAVHSVSYSRDGGRIVTASEDKTARVWDAETGKEITKLQGHTAPVLMASFSGDGAYVITAAELDRVVRVWDAKTGTEVAQLPGHLGLVYSAAFSPDGARAVTTHRNVARVWNPKTGAVVATLAGHAGVLTSAVFNRDGTRVATASIDNTAKVWDAATGAHLATLKGHQDRVFAASFNHDGKRIVTASFDGTARVWDTGTGEELGRLRGHTGQAYSAAFSGDGTRVATAANDGTVRVWLWDEKVGVEGITFGVADWHAYGLALETITAASLSLDGTRVVTGNFDGMVRVWDAAIGVRTLSWKAHPSGGIGPISLSPDGTHVATTVGDGTIRVWDARTGASVAVIKGHAQGLWSVLFSEDGKRVVTTSNDGTVRVWDAKTGREFVALKKHTDLARSVSFSPDGMRVVTPDSDNTSRVRDAKTGATLAVLKGHTGHVYSASFHPNGTRIVTASFDGTTRVWDARTGAELLILKGHTGGISCASSFSADGTRIFSTGQRGVSLPHIWDTRPLTGTLPSPAPRDR